MAGTIMITGASSGLGQELAKVFQKRDVHVIGIGAREYQDNALEFDAIDTGGRFQMSLPFGSGQPIRRSYQLVLVCRGLPLRY